MITETVSLLGRHASDRVSEFSGVITSVSFDLSGCVQAWIIPAAKEGAEAREGRWFDVQRLEVNFAGNPVMSAPDFDAGGKVPANWATGPIAKAAPSQR